MIPGHCTTNLDNYNCSLVSIFSSVPLIGHRVQVTHNGKESTLKVVGITHTVKYYKPYIIVELNK